MQSPVRVLTKVFAQELQYDEKWQVLQLASQGVHVPEAKPKPESQIVQASGLQRMQLISQAVHDPKSE